MIGISVFKKKINKNNVCGLQLLKLIPDIYLLNRHIQYDILYGYNKLYEYRFNESNKFS